MSVHIQTRLTRDYWSGEACPGRSRQKGQHCILTPLAFGVVDAVTARPALLPLPSHGDDLATCGTEHKIRRRFLMMTAFNIPLSRGAMFPSVEGNILLNRSETFPRRRHLGRADLAIPRQAHEGLSEANIFQRNIAVSNLRTRITSFLFTATGAPRYNDRPSGAGLTYTRQALPEKGS